MRKLRTRIAVVALAWMMVVLPMLSAQASGGSGNTGGAEAEAFRQLGLYNGISKQRFNPDLAGKPTREMAILFLSRFYGNALQLPAAEVDRVLNTYKDHTAIHKDSRTAFAYAIQNGLVKGIGPDRLEPQGKMSLEQYSTLALRVLGYSPVFGKALDQLVELDIISQEEASVWSKSEFTKATMLALSYKMLSAHTADAEAVIKLLVARGATEQKAAERLGLLKSEAKPEQTTEQNPKEKSEKRPDKDSVVNTNPNTNHNQDPDPQVEPAPDKNYAPWASADTSFVSQLPLTMLHDGSNDSVWSSGTSPQFPSWITLDLGELAIKTNKISIITWFAQGQAITRLDVDYWEQDAWKRALTDVQLNWTSNDTTQEVKEIVLPGIVTNKIRLTIHEANTVWGNIAISDIQWWGVEPPPKVVNVAPEGTFSAVGITTGAGAGVGFEQLNDGELQQAWTGEPDGVGPMQLELNMGASRTNTGKVTLITANAQQQGITKVELQYFDGVGWKTVAGPVTLSWQPAGAGLEKAELIFNPIFTQKLRIVIHEVAAASGAFTLHEVEVWGYAVKPPTPQVNRNQAMDAIVSSTFNGLPGQSMSAIQDGDESTSWRSAPGQSYPGVIELQFAEKIETGKLTLAAAYGQSQGITSLSIDYWDGEKWSKVADQRSITWNSDTAAVEQADIRYPAIETTALRFHVHETNSTQGQLVVNEIYVWGTERTMPVEPPLEPLPPLPEPEQLEPTGPGEGGPSTAVNVAGTATLSTTFPAMPGYDIQLVVNGDLQSAWSSGVGVQLPQTITLDWGSRTIRTGKLTFHTWYGLGQGVTNVDIEYEANGVWQTAASNQTLNWTTNDGTIEAVDLMFPPIDTSKIRLTVHQANLAWGNVSINELNVWSDQ